MVAIAAAVAVSACTPRTRHVAPDAGPDNPGAGTAADTLSLDAADVETFGADAVETLQEIADAEGFTDDNADALAAPHPDDARTAAEGAAAPHADDTRPRHGEPDGHLEARVYGGHRSERSARASWHFASAGVRDVDGRRSAFVTLSDLGALRQVHAGRAHVRFGEQLVLGRGFGSYPTAYATSAAGALSWSPSLSAFSGVDVVATTLRTGALSLQSVVARAPDATRSAWLALTADARPPGRFSVLAGWPGTVAGRPRMLAVAGQLHGAGLSFTWECAVDRTRVFGAARIAAPRFGSAAFFHAPVLTSADEPLVHFLERPGAVRGVLVDWRRIAGFRLAGRVLLTTRADADASRIRRQVWLSTHGGRQLRWKLSLYHLSETDESLARAVPQVATTVSRHATTRLRLDIEFGDRSSRHRMRADIVERGVVVAAGSRLEAGRVTAEWRAAAYALPPGRPAWVTRPGPGPFERFSSVYGRGSDLGVRIRFRLFSHSLLEAYYGRPYLNAARFYVGASYRR